MGFTNPDRETVLTIKVFKKNPTPETWSFHDGPQTTVYAMDPDTKAILGKAVFLQDVYPRLEVEELLTRMTRKETKNA